MYCVQTLQCAAVATASHVLYADPTVCSCSHSKSCTVCRPYSVQLSHLGTNLKKKKIGRCRHRTYACATTHEEQFPLPRHCGTNNLTLSPLTWRTWWAPNNASRWQMGFKSAFKGLINVLGDYLKKIRLIQNKLATSNDVGTFHLCPPLLIKQISSYVKHTG